MTICRGVTPSGGLKPCVCPCSPQRGPRPSGEHARPEHQSSAEGDGGGTSSRRDGNFISPTSRDNQSRPRRPCAMSNMWTDSSSLSTRKPRSWPFSESSTIPPIEMSPHRLSCLANEETLVVIVMDGSSTLEKRGISKTDVFPCSLTRTRPRTPSFYFVLLRRGSVCPDILLHQRT